MKALKIWTALGILFSMNSFAQVEGRELREEGSDVFRLPLHQRPAAEMPIPVGIIADFGVPVWNSDISDNQTKSKAGNLYSLSGYIDVYQVGYEKRDFVKAFSVMHRLGRVSRDYGYYGIFAEFGTSSYGDRMIGGGVKGVSRNDWLDYLANLSIGNAKGLYFNIELGLLKRFDISQHGIAVAARFFYTSLIPDNGNVPQGAIGRPTLSLMGVRISVTPAFNINL